MKTLVLSVPFLLLASCGVLKPVEDATVNYLLDPMIPERIVTGSVPAIAIARPSLPGYLDRQQLVSRNRDGQVVMNGFHVWSEPLDVAISRVMASNLGRLANSLNIQPVENFVTLDYRSLLEIRISRFEVDATKNLIFECTWKLQPVTGPVANMRSFSTRVHIADEETPKGPFGGRINAMNEALARLAREIARAL